MAEFDLIVNGAFPSNINNWNDISTGGGRIVWSSQGGGSMAMEAVEAGGRGWGEQVVPTIPGLICTLDFDAEKFGAFDDHVYIGTTSGGTEIAGPIFVEEGTNPTIEFIPTTDTTYLGFRGSVALGGFFADAIVLLQHDGFPKTIRMF